jgi:hypothetical protein
VAWVLPHDDARRGHDRKGEGVGLPLRVLFGSVRHGRMPSPAAAPTGATRPGKVSRFSAVERSKDVQMVRSREASFVGAVEFRGIRAPRGGRHLPEVVSRRRLARGLSSVGYRRRRLELRPSHSFSNRRLVFSSWRKERVFFQLNYPRYESILTHPSSLPSLRRRARADFQPAAAKRSAR